MSDATIARAVESRDAGMIEAEERAEERAEAISTRAWTIARGIVADRKKLAAWFLDRGVLLHEVTLPKVGHLCQPMTLEDALFDLIAVALNPYYAAPYVAGHAHHIASSLVDLLEKHPTIIQQATAEVDE